MKQVRPLRLRGLLNPARLVPLEDRVTIGTSRSFFCCANEADVVGDSTQDHNVDMDPCTQIQCIRLARHWPNPP